MSWIMHQNRAPFAFSVGEKIVRVVGRTGDVEATLHFESGATLKLTLDGDCCSHSYFTKDAQFEELIGATIWKVEERDELPADFKEYDLDGTDVLSWHFLVFTTDKGHVTIDWRNDSNGYYDGSVGAVYDGPPHGPWTPRQAFERGLMDQTSARVWSDYCDDAGMPENFRLGVDWKN